MIHRRVQRGRAPLCRHIGQLLGRVQTVVHLKRPRINLSDSQYFYQEAGFDEFSTSALGAIQIVSPQLLFTRLFWAFNMSLPLDSLQVLLSGRHPVFQFQIKIAAFDTS